MKHIICFHLFNDYSGSPKVLRMVLEGLLKRGHRIDLVTSRGGVLDELAGIPRMKMHTYAYHFSDNHVLTMMRYGWVQFYTFCMAFRWLFCKDAVFYINTLLPVGPALAGRLMGKRVVYHYHENAFVKGAFYKMLATIMEGLAHRIICVSEYQASFLICKEKVTVIPNALPEAFVQRLKPNPENAFEQKTVLMLGSLKEYKGTKEFIQLSQLLQQYRFILVINDTQENIDYYLKEKCYTLGENLVLYDRQADVAKFYQQASVVLNLSDKRLFIETFGLTALEAMTAGLPVIVPTEGGIAEMVDDAVNGYKIDVADLDCIGDAIKKLLTDKTKYIQMAEKALHCAKKFNADDMIERVEKILAD